MWGWTLEVDWRLEILNFCAEDKHARDDVRGSLQIFFDAEDEHAWENVREVCRCF